MPLRIQKALSFRNLNTNNESRGSQAKLSTHPRHPDMREYGMRMNNVRVGNK